MSPSTDLAAEQIAQRGLQELRRRLQVAIAEQAAQDRSGIALSPAEIEELVSGAAQRAGAELWRRSLAQAGSEILGLELGAAIAHPAVRAAHEIVGAPPYDDSGAAVTSGAPAPPTPAVAPPPPMPAAPSSVSEGAGALRVEAVHMGGIDSLRVGERDLEIRLSADGIDVLKRSTGAAIGHLLWGEVESVQTPRTRHGLRRVQELHVDTGRGRASFELPGVSEEQLADELQPLIDQLTAGA